MTLTLKAAEAIIDGALAEAAKRDLKPLTVVVLDAGGHAVALKRQDGATFLRADVATAKAWTALGLGSSRAFADMAAERPQFASSLTAITGGRMAPAAGGVLVTSAGAIVGAVGISGDVSDNDEAAALAGIAAAGLES